jgi:hypothetical protein
MIRLIGMWHGLSQNAKEISLRGKNGRGKQYRSMSQLTQGREAHLDAKDVECYYCHKKGHHIKFCILMK